jgi:hypothetical protein
LEMISQLSAKSLASLDAEPRCRDVTGGGGKATKQKT